MIDSLEPTGSTNRGAGMEAGRREHGFTLFGVGVGVGVGSDYSDAPAERPADKGDGHTLYVSTPEDAREVFCEQLPSHIELTVRDQSERPPAALTFVVDVSGSMDEPGRLNLARGSPGTMTDLLCDEDSVAIVTFSGEAETVLPMTRLGDHRGRVHDAPRPRPPSPGFRLVGYDNRRVADEDFRDDRDDGGEAGPGHTVTALYAVRTRPGVHGPLATATVRWPDPDSRTPHEESGTVATDALVDSVWEADRRPRTAGRGGRGLARRRVALGRWSRPGP